jgi:hypothetical protein
LPEFIHAQVTAFLHLGVELRKCLLSTFLIAAMHNAYLAPAIVLRLEIRPLPSRQNTYCPFHSPTNSYLTLGYDCKHYVLGT